MSRQPVRADVLRNLRAELAAGRKLVGVAVGGGLSTRAAADGHADFLLALSSGYFRQRGVSSLGAYLAADNSNMTVMRLTVCDILPRAGVTPVVFGLNATDPTIMLEDYIDTIRSVGCIALNNYPTVGLIDGAFRLALEETGISFSREVDAIRVAHEKDMFTIAFVFDRAQALQMTRAGADVVCCHLGLTVGGRLGAAKALDLESARQVALTSLRAARDARDDVITMVYGGPVVSPGDMKWFYQGTNGLIQGYIGGSAFERVPEESAIGSRVREFKLNLLDVDPNSRDLAEGDGRTVVRRMTDYVSRNYAGPVRLTEIASSLGYSRSTISKLFTQSVGVSFREYLCRYRLGVARELAEHSDLTWDQISRRVGFRDYSQFYRAFRREFGVAPTRFER